MITNDLDFHGQVVLVTGGARGIGRAISLRFGQLGAGVAFNYLAGSKAAHDTVARIQANGGQAIAIRADVADTPQVHALVKNVIDTYGQIDVLVNNAALAGGGGILDMSDEAWDRMLAINLRGPFLMAREVLKHMIPRRQGRIVNISSLSARYGSGPVNYCASKAGIFGLTRALAHEVGKHNIRVTCLCPGLTHTDGLRSLSPEAIRERVAVTDLGRVGEPEEVADVVVFLASPLSRFITGSILDVNGGRLGG